MDKRSASRLRSRGTPGSSRGAKGQSTVEMAVITPFLVLVLLTAADFGRMFYMSVELRGAARAGAQYGSYSSGSSSDTSGMQSVALSQLNLVGASPTASASYCTCASGGSPACGSSYDCTDLGPNGAYVSVSTSALFKTIVSYPGIPSSVTLTSTAVMPVQQ